MSHGATLWWERRRLWLPAAIFVLLTLAALVGYELVVAGKLGLQAGALATRKSELEALSRHRRQSEELLQQARVSRAAIAELYDRRLGSEASRLTAVMLEVKHLARQAGLSGMEAINYSDDPVLGLPLVHKSITFSALGNYDQLRAFVNLLELSPSFLSLDEIRVSGEPGDAKLRLQVQLSTLFYAGDRERGGKA